MVYSHASRDLRNRNDIYCFVPDSGGYSIPSREYGGRANLSGYLRQAGWNASYFRKTPYFITPDSYGVSNKHASNNPAKLYGLNYPSGMREYSGKQMYDSFRGSSAYGLEKKLFLN